MSEIGPRKLGREIFAPRPRPHGELQQLPRVLAAESLRRLVERTVRARACGDRVIWMLGAHVIKCGLTPILAALIRDNWVHHVAVNGAAIVHDVELALYGRTSEDVEARLVEGEFGQDASANTWIQEAVNSWPGAGLGGTIGGALCRERSPYENDSLFAAAWQAVVPITVHAALGTDVCHHHPRMDPARWGEKTMRDFSTFQDSLYHAGKQGVVLHWGSAVILPEIFLKAVANGVARGVSFRGLTVGNFDMIQHYRPRTQLIERVKALGGEGYAVTGHHEIMLPYFAGALLGAVDENS